MDNYAQARETEANALLRGTFDLENTSQPEVVRTVKEAVNIQRSRSATIMQYPLGFYRLTFSGTRFEDGHHLHVWYPGISRSEGIHTHIFELRSRVLKGLVVDNTWEARPDEMQPTHELFMPQYRGNSSTGKREVRQQVRAVNVQQNLYKEGDVYGVKKGVFHSSGVPADTLAVTLIHKTDIDKRGIPEILLPLQDQGTVGLPVREADQEEAWAAFEQSLQAL